MNCLYFDGKVTNCCSGEVFVILEEVCQRVKGLF